jgi:hypothetical protein
MLRGHLIRNQRSVGGSCEDIGGQRLVSIRNSSFRCPKVGLYWNYPRNLKKTGVTGKNEIREVCGATLQKPSGLGKVRYL